MGRRLLLWIAIGGCFVSFGAHAMPRAKARWTQSQHEIHEKLRGHFTEALRGYPEAWSKHLFRALPLHLTHLFRKNPDIELGTAKAALKPFFDREVGKLHAKQMLSSIADDPALGADEIIMRFWTGTIQQQGVYFLDPPDHALLQELGERMVKAHGPALTEVIEAVRKGEPSGPLVTKLKEIFDALDQMLPTLIGEFNQRAVTP